LRGLDLSTTTDISAFRLLFPPYGEPLTSGLSCLTSFSPRTTLKSGQSVTAFRNESWKESRGCSTSRLENVIDYDAIRLKITQLLTSTNIREIALDHLELPETHRGLDASGIICCTACDRPTGLTGRTDPTELLEILILKHDLAHLEESDPSVEWPQRSGRPWTPPALQADKSERHPRRSMASHALHCALSPPGCPDQTQTIIFLPTILHINRT